MSYFPLAAPIAKRAALVHFRGNAFAANSTQKEAPIPYLLIRKHGESQ